MEYLKFTIEIYWKSHHVTPSMKNHSVNHTEHICTEHAIDVYISSGASVSATLKKHWKNGASRLHPPVTPQTSRLHCHTQPHTNTGHGSIHLNPRAITPSHCINREGFLFKTQTPFWSSITIWIHGNPRYYTQLSERSHGTLKPGAGILHTQGKDASMAAYFGRSAPCFWSDRHFWDLAPPHSDWIPSRLKFSQCQDPLASQRS